MNKSSAGTMYTTGNPLQGETTACNTRGGFDSAARCQSLKGTSAATKGIPGCLHEHPSRRAAEGPLAA